MNHDSFVNHEYSREDGKVKIMRRFRVWMLLVLSLALLLPAGCGQTEKTAPEKLKIGILPVEDIMPSVVAVENGYFAQENIDVELVRFQSAVEQGNAMQSGQLDGMITDLVVSTLLKDSGQDLKVTSITLGSTPEEGRFGIVAAPKSGIATLEDLKGKEVGISNNSIIEYVTDGLLEDGGIVCAKNPLTPGNAFQQPN